jgi:hypothetical protein
LCLMPDFILSSYDNKYKQTKYTLEK